MQTVKFDPSLGPPESWPCSLQSAVSICLGSRLPTAILCGEQSIVLYNDAYAPILGIKHPAALGRPGAAVWQEVWQIVSPMLDGVRRTGNSVGSNDLLLFINRSGFLEENYFTFSYSPIGMNEGEIKSVFAWVLESTVEVLSKRRIQTIQNLSTCLTEHSNMDVLCPRLMSELEKNKMDIPFALLYLIDSERKNGSLVGTAGVNDNKSLAVPTYPFHDSEEKCTENLLWPLAEVAITGKSRIVDVSHLLNLPHGHWDKPPLQVILLPITAPGQDLPTGILVAAVSPMRILDESYINFYDTAATHMALAIANSRAYEEAFQRAEALAEIDRAKTLFFSNISHEFRTPLALILGPLDDALNHEQIWSSRQREAIVLAKRNALRLLKLVNTLLDFSRLEAGRTQAVFRPCSLDLLTAELIGVFRSAIEKAGLTLVVEFEALEELVYVDWDMWEKIVYNLLSNALKYTHEGTIRVTLKKLSRHVEFSVRDTGFGIPEGELSKIFERFYRAENVHGRSFEGSGIGLSLIEELIKMHGGTIRVVSKPTEGSLFTVSIPRGSTHLPQDRIRTSETLPTPTLTGTAFVEEAMHWLPSRSPAENKDAFSEVNYSLAQEGAVNLKKPCILLVDDNRDMRDYVTRLLTNNYQVIAVADGKAALEEALLHKPQLVLSDVMMPKLDGFELIQALRANPVTQMLPIILLSARAGEEAKVEGLERGADDYLVKPFSAKELLARVKTHLELGQLRRSLEEAVEKSVRELKILTRISPVGMYRTDREGRLLYINEKGCQVLGLTLEQAKGFGWHQAVHAEDKERVLSTTLQNRNAATDHFKLEYRISHLNDAVVEVIADVAIERNNNRVIIGFVGTLTDITDLRVLERAHFEAIRSSEEQQRKRAEDAEQHRKVLEVFVDTMCHELRNPLNGIYGNVNLLKTNSAALKTEVQTGNLEDLKSKFIKHILEEEEAFASIEKCVRYQKVITDDVLSLSKLEAGKLELNYADFKPNQLVRDILNMIERQAKDKCILFRFDLLPTDMVIRADPNRITQILLNLLTNAIKFSPQESGEITIRIKLPANDSLMQIVVEDNGIGMTEEEKKKLFDRFSQANCKTSAEYGGSGLGLAISKNLVLLMGGEINVKTAKGKGTKIDFTFQYLPGKDVSIQADQSLTLTPASVEGMRILIAEDNVINQKILMKQLTQSGCQCILANNGQEALDSFEKHPLDVVLMDIEMPVLNGLEATRAIRKKEQELQRKLLIPIIGLSGNARSEQREIALDSGMTDYLVKPYEKAKLVSAIARFKSEQYFPSSPTHNVQFLASHAEQKQAISLADSTASLSDLRINIEREMSNEDNLFVPSFLPLRLASSTSSCTAAYEKVVLCELCRITSLLDIGSFWRYKHIKDTFYLVTKSENGDQLRCLHQYLTKNGLIHLKLTQTQILSPLAESEMRMSTTLKLKVENLIQLKAIPIMPTVDSLGALSFIF